MAMPPGTYTLGPASASLRVQTGREGRAARAGHNLEIEVRDWAATVELGAAPEETRLSLTANSRSLRVLDGAGGMKALTAEDKQSIATTIDDDILKGGEISFSSTHVHAVEGGDDLHVHGDLNLLGKSAPVAFRLAIAADRSVAGEAVIKQSDHGIKPYSAMLGALKVKDELRVTVEGRLA
ncbi:MAG: YceI family protein [Conexibacteraceae bacterium]|nr:YceI family protein [Conexibacteraceae bacterium]